MAFNRWSHGVEPTAYLVVRNVTGIAEKCGQPMLAQTRGKGRPRHPLIPQTVIETVIPAPRPDDE